MGKYVSALEEYCTFGETSKPQPKAVLKQTFALPPAAENSIIHLGSLSCLLSTTPQQSILLDHAGPPHKLHIVQVSTTAQMSSIQITGDNFKGIKYQCGRHEQYQENQLHFFSNKELPLNKTPWEVKRHIWY